MEARPAIEAADARLVVVTPQSADRAAIWRDEMALRETLVIADPERTLYKALGARRPTPLWVLRPRVATAGVRALLAGERVSVSRGDDTLQLGADVVLDAKGQIAFLHLAADAADRTPPQKLISVLARLDLAPTAGVVREVSAVD